MVKFLLVLYFTADKLEESRIEEELAEILMDNHIMKMMEMPAVPRVGENIYLGESFEVTSVYHDIKKHIVEVRCDVNLFQGVIAFIQDKKGWNLEELASGRGLFYERVEQFEERRKRGKMLKK